MLISANECLVLGPWTEVNEGIPLNDCRTESNQTQRKQTLFLQNETQRNWTGVFSTQGEIFKSHIYDNHKLFNSNAHI